MKINKFFLIACMASLTLGFASCSDDYSYSPGEEVGTANVTFADEQNVTLGLTDTSFDIVLQRADGSGSLTVPVNVVKKADVLTVPSEVTFASGATEAKLTVTVSSDAEAFVDYPLALTIPSQYAGGTYKEQSTYPTMNITIHKEDYKKYGVMTYTSWFFEDTWEVDMYYSEYLDLYRAEIFTDGYPFYMKITEDGIITITDNTGVEKTDTESGYVHSTYGMVTARWLSSNFTGYDTDAYYIPFQWRVSAGSFGSGYDSFTVTPVN